MFQLKIKKTLLTFFCLFIIVACNSAPEKIIFKNRAFVDIPKTYPSVIAEAEQGNTESAIKQLTKLTQKNPDFAPVFTNLGLQLLKAGNLPEAQSALKKTVELKLDNAVAYNHLGVISRMNGDFDTARSQYQKAIKYNPDYANAHLNLGILLDIYLYELDTALQHYENYQSLTGNNDKLVSKWIIDIQRRIKADQNRAL